MEFTLNAKVIVHEQEFASDQVSMARSPPPAFISALTAQKYLGGAATAMCRHIRGTYRVRCKSHILTPTDLTTRSRFDSKNCLSQFLRNPVSVQYVVRQSVATRMCSLSYRAEGPVATGPEESSKSRSGSSSPPHKKDDDFSGGDSSELLSAIKEFVARGAVRKIVTTVIETESGGGVFARIVPNAAVYRTAIRGLIRHSRVDLAIELYNLRIKASEQRPDALEPDVPLAAGIMRQIFREKRKRSEASFDPEVVFTQLEIGCKINENDPHNAAQMASSLVSLISSLLDGDNVSEDRIRYAFRATQILRTLCISVGETVPLPASDFNNVIRLFGKRRRLDGVFATVDSMRAAHVELNNETFEFLANAAVRQVEFVTGAVSMETLPPPLGAEVAFFGRSNVGKSSLVNMLCNRKALAHVSSRPGKTQQFNFFVVNSKDKTSSFYLVDLPGVGYAKVPKHVQEKWLDFMDDYIGSRPSLSVIFHLIDGRHGPLPEDELLMDRVASSRYSGKYVIAVTKADKIESDRSLKAVIRSTSAALQKNNCPPDTPILPTSASTRRGRDELWRYLQNAIRL